MDHLITVFSGAFRNGSLMLTMLIFLATGTLAFSMMAALRVRGSVRRRHARIMSEDGRANPGGSLRHSSVAAVAKLIDYTNRHYVSADNDGMKVLRQRLSQAGVYDPRGVAYFFLIRVALSLVLAGGMVLMLPMMGIGKGNLPVFLVVIGVAVGYVGPGIYLDKRIAARKLECASGFPDFMDLLVVCADSGLSMEASLERVGRELAETWPALGSNIHIANLEVRAGRTLKDALERFAGRVGLEESRAFATLINQSIELGSSITDALRVYADDMRHKRLSRAEEKAHALPAKLSVAMMACIFPVIFVVILLPVFVRLKMGNYF